MCSVSSLSKNFIAFYGLLFFISCTGLETGFQKTRDWDFQPPLKKTVITQQYKPYKREPHLGIDFSGPIGTPVLSIESGRVVYVGEQFTGYGKLVIIEHDALWTSLYAHLDSFSVKLGNRVKKSQKIGTLGNTGKSTGPHLHLEIFYKKKNINPDFIFNK